MAMIQNMTDSLKSMRLRKKGADSYRHGDLKKGLIVAALRTIQKKGGVEFTIREIASATGVTHTAAYKHFKSKTDLLLAIAVEGFALLSAQFKNVQKRDPCDMVGLGQAYVNFAVDNPSFFQVMFHPDLKEYCGDPLQPTAVGFETYQILMSCIEENKKLGKFVDVPTEELALAAWSMVHGLSALWSNGNLSQMNVSPEIFRKEVSRRIPEIFLNGLLKR